MHDGANGHDPPDCGCSLAEALVRCSCVCVCVCVCIGAITPLLAAIFVVPRPISIAFTAHEPLIQPQRRGIRIRLQGRRVGVGRWRVTPVAAVTTTSPWRGQCPRSRDTVRARPATLGVPVRCTFIAFISPLRCFICELCCWRFCRRFCWRCCCEWR
jgi:hypothetical protein